MIEEIVRFFLSIQFVAFIITGITLFLFVGIRFLSGRESLFILKTLFVVLISLPLLAELPIESSITDKFDTSVDDWFIGFSLGETNLSQSPALTLTTTSTNSFPSGQLIFLSLYLIGSMVCVSQLLLSWIKTNRQVNSLKPSQNDDLNNKVKTLCRQVGIRKSVSVVMDDSGITPYTWGLFLQVIVLPSHFPDWSEDQQHSVLLHELTHIKRRDLLASFGIELICRLYWLNPLVWFARKKFKLELERSCDECVLDTGVSSVAYAEHLVNVAHQFVPQKNTLSHKLMITNASSLSQRIAKLLSPQSRRENVKFTSRLMIIGLYLGFSLTCIAATKETENATRIAPSEAWVFFSAIRRSLYPEDMLHGEPNYVEAKVNLDRLEAGYDDLSTADKAIFLGLNSSYNMFIGEKSDAIRLLEKTLTLDDLDEGLQLRIELRLGRLNQTGRNKWEWIPWDRLALGKPGWCNVSYTVNETGHPTDIEIGISEPDEEYVKEYCFRIVPSRIWHKPLIKDGKAVAVPGMRGKMGFSLQDVDYRRSNE